MICAGSTLWGLIDHLPWTAVQASHASYHALKHLQLLYSSVDMLMLRSVSYLSSSGKQMQWIIDLAPANATCFSTSLSELECPLQGPQLSVYQ